MCNVNNNVYTPTLERIIMNAPQAPITAPETATNSADLITSDLLIEDVSIDGMCGVY
jgi:mycofactocin precursor